jgi:hypothetical protein
MYVDVIRRHRGLVVAGTVITVLLALLAYVRVSPDGIAYRSSQVWSNQATLALSQKGFPEGRSVLPESVPNGSFATPDRFSSLVGYYVALATSDEVAALLKRRGLIDAKSIQDGTLPITAATLSPTVSSPAPLLQLTASAESPVAAKTLTLGATRAFLDVLESRQKAAKIPENQRIVVRVVKRFGEPTLIVPRSKTKSIIVLLAGLTATFAAAFIRDNLRRRTAFAGPEKLPVTAVPSQMAGPEAGAGSDAVAPADGPAHELKRRVRPTLQAETADSTARALAKSRSSARSSG